MVTKGKYMLVYVLDKKHIELLVEVNIKQVDGLVKPLQNIYYGTAYVDGVIYTKKDLSCHVNAKFAAEEIGLELKNEIKEKLHAENKRLKIIKEEIL